MQDKFYIWVDQRPRGTEWASSEEEVCLIVAKLYGVDVSRVACRRVCDERVD